MPLSNQTHIFPGIQQYSHSDERLSFELKCDEPASTGWYMLQALKVNADVSKLRLLSMPPSLTMQLPTRQFCKSVEAQVW